MYSIVYSLQLVLSNCHCYVLLSMKSCLSFLEMISPQCKYGYTCSKSSARIQVHKTKLSKPVCRQRPSCQLNFWMNEAILAHTVPC